MTGHFREFFRAAPGHTPSPHRERLAAGAGPSGTPGSLLVNVPAGADGTAHVLRSSRETSDGAGPERRGRPRANRWAAGGGQKLP